MTAFQTAVTIGVLAAWLLMILAAWHLIVRKNPRKRRKRGDRPCNHTRQN